jgi:hypothetical protein
MWQASLSCTGADGALQQPWQQLFWLGDCCGFMAGGACNHKQAAVLGSSSMHFAANGCKHVQQVHNLRQL